MTWDDIDQDVWTMPASKSKNGDPNRVPILPLMADLIEQAKVYCGKWR